MGNESWGCGGNFAPEGYAIEFRRFVEWVPHYESPLSLIGASPNGGGLEWTRRFFGKLAERNSLQRIWVSALHHYSWNASGGRTTNWFEGKGDALKFNTEGYYEILHEGDRMESLITDHWAVMGSLDRQRRVKLVVEEWGSWYRQGTEPFPEALIGQQNTMRDALLAGLTLDTFNRHSDKVAMANVAQLVNYWQSLFLAHEDKFCVTPTYHVFNMYAAHQGAKAVRSVFSAGHLSYQRNGQPASLYGLNGSASLNGRHLTLTVTNPSLDQARQTEISLRGATARSVRIVTLAAGDVHAFNSFDSPQVVQPREQALAVSQPSFTYQFPPASVARLEIALV